jgi:hypothetical protein
MSSCRRLRRSLADPLRKTDRPNTAPESPKCECAAERQANSASPVHGAPDSHRERSDVLQRDTNHLGLPPAACEFQRRRDCYHVASKQYRVDLRFPHVLPNNTSPLMRRFCQSKRTTILKPSRLPLRITLARG